MSPRLPAFLLALASTVALAAPVKTEHVEAELLAESKAAAPGKPSLVGLKLRMADHWHTYWKNPGDSGLPTKIDWKLPEGWKAGEIQWPHPQKIPVGPLMNYGYEDEVLLMAEVTPPAGAKLGPMDLKASASWLVCREVCVPEKGDFTLAFNIADGNAPTDPRNVGHFEHAKSQLPVPLSGWKMSAGRSGTKLTLRIEPPAGVTIPANVFFFPDRENLIEAAAPQALTRDGNALRIEAPLVEPVPDDITTLAGVLVADKAWPTTDNRKAVLFNATVGPALGAAAAATATPVFPTAGTSATSIGPALVFAFIGGLFLNLMPCVFPVLGIKVLGFVEHAHGDAKALRTQGLVFALGVVISFLVLAGIMLALRAGGTQLGWGFQLQSPAFVTILAALFFVLGLNLSGVFEWGAFAQSMTSNVSAKGRYADALLAGALATLVATPCTAPFMGAAVGFTLAQPAFVSLAVFAMVAIGMAVPVTLLSFFPKLLRFLPKPGAWMETFKQVMAFPLYATVAWLAWVLGAQAGNDSVLALLAGLVAIAMAAWVWGRWGTSESFLRPAFTAAFAALGIYVAWPAAVTAGGSAAPVTFAQGELPWQAWSPEKLASLRATDTPVFVDFTASWCVTCQVNKRVALRNDGVVKAFADRGIVALKADWTRQDPRITAALTDLGRNAVPVYALYPPGGGAPALLPELLTPSAVLDEISRLPAQKARTGTTAVTQR
jgi:thiol:disulfide interchange protein/DsbC/DsbD-like thiol-disulfide interchange protein